MRPKPPKGWRRPPTPDELALLRNTLVPTDESSGRLAPSATLGRPIEDPGGTGPGAPPATTPTLELELDPETYSDEPDGPTQPTERDQAPPAVRARQHREARELARLQEALPMIGERLALMQAPTVRTTPPVVDEPTEIDVPRVPVPDPWLDPHRPRPAPAPRRAPQVELQPWLLAVLVGLAVVAGGGVALATLFCGLLIRGVS